MGLFPLGHFAVDWPAGGLWLLAPAIGLAMDLAPAEVGFAITAHSIGGGLAYIPAGFLSDRVSRRGLLFLAPFFWVVAGYLAAAMAPNYWALVALLGVAGLGGAAWHPMATGAMVQNMPGRRALLLGVHQTGGVLADVLAPLTVGFLLVVLDWRDVLRLLVIPAGVMGLLFLRWSWAVGPSTERVGVVDGLRTLWGAWSRPSGVGMLLVMAGASVALTALMAMTPLYLQQVHGYSSGWAGTFFAAMLLAAAVSAPFAGRASDQIGRKPVTVAGLLAGGAGGLVLAFVDNSVALVLGAMLAGAALVSVRPPILAAAVELVGRHESAALGLIYAAMDGVGALGAVFAGVAGGVDLRFAIVFAAAVSIATAVLSIAVPFKEAHRGSLEPRR